MQQKLYREELLQIFPQKLRQRIEESVTFKNLTEIRLRADLPVLIETTQEKSASILFLLTQKKSGKDLLL